MSIFEFVSAQDLSDILTNITVESIINFVTVFVAALVTIFSCIKKIKNALSLNDNNMNSQVDKIKKLSEDNMQKTIDTFDTAINKMQETINLDINKAMHLLQSVSTEAANYATTLQNLTEIEKKLNENMVIISNAIVNLHNKEKQIDSITHVLALVVTQNKEFVKSGIAEKVCKMLGITKIDENINETNKEEIQIKEV